MTIIVTPSVHLRVTCADIDRTAESSGSDEAKGNSEELHDDLVWTRGNRLVLGIYGRYIVGVDRVQEVKSESSYLGSDRVFIGNNGWEENTRRLVLTTAKRKR